MKNVIARTNEVIGFSIVLLGMSGMDSESLVYPIALAATGALMMFIGMMMEGVKD